MGTIKELREKLGLTQKEISVFLEIPRSTYSLVEIEKRSFTANTLIKAGYLELALLNEKFRQAAVQNFEAAENNKSGYGKMLESRIKDCNHAQLALERKRNGVVQDYNAAENLLRLTDVFFEVYPERKEFERDRKWIDLMNRLAKHKYMENKLLLMELELEEHKIKCELQKATEMLAAGV